MESGQTDLDGWVLNYNLFREHEGIGHKTPGEMADVNPPFKEWADVVRYAPALRKGLKTGAAMDTPRREPETTPPSGR